MSQMVEGNTKSFKVGASAIARGTRVKLTAGLLVAAGLAERHVGIMTARAEIGEHAGVYVPLMSGTVQMIAADAITLGAEVYSAASGKISDSAGAGSFRIGIALEAASGDGSIIEVLLDAPQIPATAQGVATASAQNATDNYVDIDTGLGAVTTLQVMIVRSNIVQFKDQVVTITAGVIRVADGASTYQVTASDKIYWWARA